MKTVFLTGASSGIGKALALEYGRRGAFVTLAARRKEALDEVAAQISASGGRASAVTLDVADTASVEEAVKRADRDMGSLDVVIANAGTSQAVRAPLLTVEACLAIVDVNVRGALATLLAAVPSMVAARRGHLVAVSSLAGLRAMPGFGPYSATKAAVSVFLETLRIELAPVGIRVTDVMPGFVDTPLVPKDLYTPFKWPVDKAARYVVDKLDRAPRVIAFPWPLAALMGLGRRLPAFLWEPIMRGLVK